MLFLEFLLDLEGIAILVKLLAGISNLRRPLLLLLALNAKSSHFLLQIVINLLDPFSQFRLLDVLKYRFDL